MYKEGRIGKYTRLGKDIWNLFVQIAQSKYIKWSKEWRTQVQTSASRTVIQHVTNELLSQQLNNHFNSGSVAKKLVMLF